MKHICVLLLLSVVSFATPCPKQIQVGSYKYTLRFELMDPRTLARTDFFNQVIHVGTGYPEDEMREALIHELFHAAMYETLGRTADFFKKHKYRDDQFIESVAPILTKTLHENPELLTCELK